MRTVKEIYQEINAFAPFSTQENWDNSGLLIGEMNQEVSGVLVTLDISLQAVQEAAKQHCNLIIAHHPVIFSGLKHISSESVVYALIRENISAICCHTPLDSAQIGINDLIVNKLKKVFEIENKIFPIESNGTGRIIKLKQKISLPEFAEKVKSVLPCEVVRYSANYSENVQKIAICSGSGASLLEELKGRCDCFLTGDVKHDRWYKAEELKIALLDCGHYATEVLMIPFVAEKLRQAFPELTIIEHAQKNPVCYA